MKRLFFLLVFKSAFILASGANESSYRKCLLSLSSGSASSNTAPLSKFNFLFDGVTYVIPQRFSSLAEKISSSLIPPNRKPELLLALDGIFNEENRTHDGLSPFLRDMFNRIIEKELPLPQGVSELAISVHQKKSYQEATASFLDKENSLKGVPLVSLVSSTFQMTSSPLVDRTSQFRWSNYGEMAGIPETVNTLHFFGGNCNQCLSVTLKDVALEKFSVERKVPLDVFIYAGLSYTQQGPELPNLSLASSISSKTDFHFEEELELQRVLGCRELPGGQGVRAKSSAPEYVNTAHGPAYLINVTWPDRIAPMRIYILAK